MYSVAGFRCGHRSVAALFVPTSPKSSGCYVATSRNILSARLASGISKVSVTCICLSRSIKKFTHMRSCIRVNRDRPDDEGGAVKKLPLSV
jgi:hypothetical protein